MSFGGEDIVYPLNDEDDNESCTRILSLEYMSRCQAAENNVSPSPIATFLSDLESDPELKRKLARSIATIVAFKSALYSGKEITLAKELLDRQFELLDFVCSFGTVTGDVLYQDEAGDIKEYKMFEFDSLYKQMEEVLDGFLEKVFANVLYEHQENPQGFTQTYLKTGELLEVKKTHANLAKYIDENTSLLEEDIARLGLSFKAKPWGHLTDEPLSNFVQDGMNLLSSDLLAVLVKYVEALSNIIQSYETEMQARHVLGQEIATRTRDQRWTQMLAKDKQCSLFSRRHRDFSHWAYGLDDLRREQDAFYTSLTEYQKLKNIDEKLKQIMTAYGISYYITERGVQLNPRQYDAGKLRKGVQELTMQSANLDSIVRDRLTQNMRSDSLVEKLIDFETNIKGDSRNPVKAMIVRMIRSFAANWSQFVAGYFNFYITGPAGSGKSTIASNIGPVLASMGILIFGRYIDESPATLVGEYVGQTAIKTRGRLINAIENVMFIDEAYAVAKGEGSGDGGGGDKKKMRTRTQGGGGGKFDQFGREAIDEIVGFLDKHQGQISVIVAGYECDMREYFMEVNEGLPRRFPEKYRIALPRLCPKELWQIFADNLRKSVRIILGPQATESNVLTGAAQNVFKGAFYAGSGIPGKDPTEGTVTFRHLFENEASDAAELAQSVSLAFFERGGNTLLDAPDVIPGLVDWLKNREKQGVKFDAERDSNCNPVCEYPSATITGEEATAKPRHANVSAAEISNDQISQLATQGSFNPPVAEGVRLPPELISSMQQMTLSEGSSERQPQPLQQRPSLPPPLLPQSTRSRARMGVGSFRPSGIEGEFENEALVAQGEATLRDLGFTRVKKGVYTVQTKDGTTVDITFPKKGSTARMCKTGGRNVDLETVQKVCSVAGLGISNDINEMEQRIRQFLEERNA